MLEANKSRVFEKIFSIYNRNLLKRRFHSFHVSGLDSLFNKSTQIPLIIYCNHSSWWDGLVAFEISIMTSLESYIMMEEKQLKNLRLFRKLGAFSVVRENPREAMQSLKYAVGLLQENSRSTLWIFPQGEILPNDTRPLKFYNGLAKIIEKVEICSATSLSMRYEFLGEFKPRIFVRIEKPDLFKIDSYFNVRQLTARLETRLTANLEKLKKDIIEQDFDGYKTIF